MKDSLFEFGLLVKASIENGLEGVGVDFSQSIQYEYNKIISEVSNYLAKKVLLLKNGCLALVRYTNISVLPRHFGICAIYLEGNTLNVLVYKKTILPETILVDCDEYKVNVIQSPCYYDSYILNESMDKELYSEALSFILS